MISANVPSKREQVIETWMLSIIKDGGVDRFDDLHVDRIDDKWKHRNIWFEAGLEAWHLAIHLRDKHRLDYTVVLAFSLEAGESTRGVDFTTRAQLESCFDWSPPSLYLFRRNQEPRMRTAVAGAENISVKDVEPKMFGLPVEARHCYYIEFRQIDTGAYSRTVFVEG
jgi:hypothetical protein